MLADAITGDKRLERFRHTRRELEPRPGHGVTLNIHYSTKGVDAPSERRTATNGPNTLKVPPRGSRWEPNPRSRAGLAGGPIDATKLSVRCTHAAGDGAAHAIRWRRERSDTGTSCVARGTPDGRAGARRPASGSATRTRPSDPDRSVRAHGPAPRGPRRPS